MLALRLHLFIIFLSLSASSMAQVATDPLSAIGLEEVEINVLVRAKGSGKLIKRAEVRVGTKTFFTDSQGRVGVSIPKSGDGKILVSKVGYEKELIDFSELRDAKTVEFYLYPAAPLDNEVVIRGDKRPEVSKKTFSVIESSRVAPNDDPVQVAALLPGVQTAAFGPEVAVRGSAPEDSQYFIDRFRVSSIFHAINDLSVVPDQLVSDVEFYAGGFGPQFGDATGGVIVVKTKTDIPEESKTTVKVNLPFYSALYHERPLSDSSMIATSIRYSYLQYVLPLLLPEDLGATVVPYFGDAHVFYVNKDDNGGFYKVFAMGSQDGLDLVFNYDESSSSDGKGTIDIYRGFATFGVQRFKSLGDSWFLDVSPQFLYDKTDFGFFSDTLAWNFYRASVYAELSKRLSKNEYFYLGIDPNYGIFEANISAPVPSDDPLYDFEDAERRKLTRTIPFSSVAAWTSIDRQIGVSVFSPGLRAYYDSQIRQASVDPRLSFRYELSDQHVLKASYGLYSRAPGPDESSKEFGNPHLDFERSIHYVAGWEGKWSDRWETDLQLYYKDLYDLVVDDDESVKSNDGLGKSYGAEVFVRRNLTEKAFGWVSYTYSRTRLKDGSDKPWRSSDFDQTHVAVITGSYRLSAQFDLGTRIKYHTGDTYTPISDAVYNASLDKYQPRSSDADRNSGRLPDYYQIDLFATQDILYDTWKMAIRYGVNYLAPKKQVYAKTNNYDYSKESDFNSVPPIPFIEIKGEF